MITSSDLETFLVEAKHFVKLEGFYWEAPEIKPSTTEIPYLRLCFNRWGLHARSLTLRYYKLDDLTLNTKLEHVKSIIWFHENQPVKQV